MSLKAGRAGYFSVGQEWLSSPVKKYHSIGEQALPVAPRKTRKQGPFYGFIYGSIYKINTEKKCFILYLGLEYKILKLIIFYKI